MAPREAHGDYLNRKGWYSLILQAVCDDKYIFRDINIGWPGRVHDARVFSNSEIFQKGEESRLFPKWFKKVSLSDKDVQLPVVILGDPAYPLRSWLLKPFPNRGALSSSQRVFNSRLSSARRTIENSFGRLKGRWRCLQKRLDVGVEFSCTVIAECVVLHNICEIHNHRFDDIWHVEEPLQGDMEDDGQEDAADQPGKVTRDNVMQAFTEAVL
ncbi:putative nuclease HARBI1 [Haliotis asinina]|uniref:putative nuclease HARBI1 n=1 Tax=Haliotis asinina TaxID=109174 RepID=UPI003531D404